MYQVIILNEKGATLRTGPSTSAGEIEKAAQGAIFEIDRLVYSLPQPFNTTHIPEFWAALAAKTLRGDVWAQVQGLRVYKGQQVTAYIAVRVNQVLYSGVVGSESGAPGPGLDQRQEIKIRQDEIDRMFRYLSTRRVDLENE